MNAKANVTVIPSVLDEAFLLASGNRDGGGDEGRKLSRAGEGNADANALRKRVCGHNANEEHGLTSVEFDEPSDAGVFPFDDEHFTDQMPTSPITIPATSRAGLIVTPSATRL